MLFLAAEATVDDQGNLLVSGVKFLLVLVVVLILLGIVFKILHKPLTKGYWILSFALALLIAIIVQLTIGVL
jgi:hypothetical protein